MSFLSGEEISSVGFKYLFNVISYKMLYDFLLYEERTKQTPFYNSVQWKAEKDWPRVRKWPSGYLCLRPSIKLYCLIDMECLVAPGTKMPGDMTPPKLLAEFAELKGAWVGSFVEIALLSCEFSVVIKEV